MLRCFAITKYRKRKEKLQQPLKQTQMHTYDKNNMSHEEAK